MSFEDIDFYKEKELNPKAAPKVTKTALELLNITRIPVECRKSTISKNNESLTTAVTSKKIVNLTSSQTNAKSIPPVSFKGNKEKSSITNVKYQHLFKKVLESQL